MKLQHGDGIPKTTVDSGWDRWAYGTPGGLGIVSVAPTVTFGGPSPRQPRIAVTNIASLEWEQVAWSREVWIADYQTSTGRGCEKMGLASSENCENLRKLVVAKMPVPILSQPRMAKLTTGYDGYLVYPHYRHHPEILQPLEHTTVQVEVELAEPVPDGMVGTLHLAWYAPDNTAGNEPSIPPAHNRHGRRANVQDVELLEAGASFLGFSLPRTARHLWCLLVE